jgi:chemotaxis protein CheD
MIGGPDQPVETMPDVECSRVYVHPGQLTVAVRPCTITTILGSCVAVCLFDPVARIGGLNHFLLPQSTARRDSLRFGDVAVPRLVTAMVECGAAQHRLQAKVVGGSCMLDRYRTNPFHVGSQNVRAALQALLEAGIPVVLKEVEGNRGRRVTLHAHTGELVVQVLGAASIPESERTTDGR